MRRLLTLIVAVLFISCTEQNKPAAENTIEGLIKNQNTTYTDSGKSSFELFEHGYRTIEVTYKPLYIRQDGEASEHYMAKTTTSSSFYSGAMKAERKIKVEMTLFDDPTKPKIIIEKECDELNLEEEYYEVVVSGCCGAENELEYYDYNNRLIILGTTIIINCEIPNSDINFYAAASHGIQLSYGSDDKYVIELEFDPNIEDHCGPLPMMVYFESPNKNDHFDQPNMYTFSSLDGIKDKSQINDITLKVAHPCNEKVDTLRIPIINGKPFGKDYRHQKAMIKMKR